MNRQGLDEMQIQKKNKIGDQTFLLLLYLLLLDVGLCGFGFRWLSYPSNIMLIVTFCSAVYVIRMITANAFVGPSAERRNPIVKALITVVLAIAVSATILVLLKNASFSSPAKIDEMASPILFFTSAVAIVIAAVTTIIKCIQNRNDGE